MKLILGQAFTPNDSVKLYKGADGAAIIMRVINDDGSLLDTTGSTVTLELYTDTVRTAASVDSLTPAVTAATSGHLTLTPTAASINIGPGIFYAFAKRVVTAGGATTISQNYVKVVIG